MINKYQIGTLEFSVMQLWIDLHKDSSFNKKSYDEKINVIHDYMNYYDDGSRVKDEYGHIVDEVTKKEIIEIIKPQYVNNIISRIGSNKKKNKKKIKKSKKLKKSKKSKK